MFALNRSESYIIVIIKRISKIICVLFVLCGEFFGRATVVKYTILVSVSVLTVCSLFVRNIFEITLSDENKIVRSTSKNSNDKRCHVLNLN